MCITIPDGKGTICMESDNFGPPRNSVFWNPGNKVVQCHRTGIINHHLTNIERFNRGLAVPWRPEFGEAETQMADIP